MTIATGRFSGRHRQRRDRLYGQALADAANPAGSRGGDRLPAWIACVAGTFKRRRLDAESVGMIEVATSIQVDRPVPEVFGYVANVFNLPKWNRQIASVTVHSPSPLVTGSRFRVRTRAYGRHPFELAYLVTGLTPNSFLSATARAAPRIVNGITVDDEGWISFRIERSFTDLGATTRLDLNYCFEELPFGGLTRWSDRILQRRTKRQLQRHERNLKRRIEESPVRPRAPVETRER